MTDEELIEQENQKILDELRKGEQEDDTIYQFDPNQKQETPYWQLTPEQESHNQAVGGYIMGAAVAITLLIHFIFL